MVKILIGLVAAIVIAAGGFFGFERYMQHRVEGEVEAAFEQIRAAGGKASHGKVSFDLSTRTVTVADIAAESAAPMPASVKIASITASGARQPDAARFAADTIEVSGIEVDVEHGRRAGRARHLQGAADHREGLFRSHQPAAATTGFVVHHRHLPVRVRAIRRRQRVVGHGSHPCRDHELRRRDARAEATSPIRVLTCHGIKDGKIAAMNADGSVIHVQHATGRQGHKVTGNLANFAAYDFDAARGRCHARSAEGQ